MTKNKNHPSASLDLKPDGSPSCFHTGPPDASKITIAGHDYYSSSYSRTLPTRIERVLVHMISFSLRLERSLSVNIHRKP